MKDNEAECYVCGTVMNRYWMDKKTIGKSVKWICPKCIESGRRQADYVTHRPGRPAIRENEGK